MNYEEPEVVEPEVVPIEEQKVETEVKEKVKKYRIEITKTIQTQIWHKPLFGDQESTSAFNHEINNLGMLPLRIALGYS